MSTEIICWPDYIEFGGVVWRKENTTDRIAYEAIQDGIGEVRVSQYPDDGRWHARNSLDKLFNDKLDTKYLYHEPSTITDTINEAMLFCLNALALAQADLMKMLRAFGIGDPYSVGYRDGQADIKAKIAEAMQ